MGSDYPHPEGTTEPMTLLNEVDGFLIPELRKLFVENAASLLKPPR
jgi:hypothetical protein